MEGMGFLLLLTILKRVVSWNELNYPGLDSENCNRDPNPLFDSFLCDPDGLLFPADAQWANEKLNGINSETTCECFARAKCHNETGGYSVGMALLQKLESKENKVALSDTLPSFARTIRDKWRLGHCNDDVLIAICAECEEVFLMHGDFTTARKIPEKVRKKMTREAKNLLKFTNYTILLQYLINNYDIFLTNKNRTPSLSMLELPFPDLSTGVITVMVLTSLLSVAWALCLTYLVLQYVRRRKFRLSERVKPRGRTERAGTVDATSSSISLSLGPNSAQRIISPSSGKNGAVPRLSRGTLGVEMDGEGQSPLWLHAASGHQWNTPASGSHPLHQARNSSVFSDTFTEPRDTASGSMINFVPAVNAMRKKILCRQRAHHPEKDSVKLSFLNRAKSFTSSSPSDNRVAQNQPDSDESGCRMELLPDDLVVHRNGSMPNMSLLDNEQ